eukprot:CAMPEP_0114678482 /NCGR_PEP_ID=MMETSP0191-20121206/51802_1 /TAXON_ID=126664 /ORGANISM="Sorites sp." /LENGTH=50 /DNA_ID=CAMNT_0001952569 /DNA_START=758 /DNA_END=910 /DNA_ORIENTATION=+
MVANDIPPIFAIVSRVLAGTNAAGLDNPYATYPPNATAPTPPNTFNPEFG